MSYQGQTWVDTIALPLLKNTGELVVMLRVANHAGNGPAKMSGCFAGSKTLASECLMSPRAAQAHLRELTRRSLLIPGDPRLVEHIRPDLRPPVYDLAGAHEKACPGGHDINGDCQPDAAGGKICHPSPEGKNPRSAGSNNCYPSPKKPATGSKKRPERVAESATKSSKELKDSRLSPDAPSQAAPLTSAEGGEREAATQKPTDTDRVLDAFIASYMSTAGLPPRPDAIKAVRTDAAALLSVGRSVANLCTLAAQLGAKGWTDLVKHAQMNPEASGGPAVNRKPWCGQCNNGRDPMSAAERMVETDTGMIKCHCHPGYVPTQPAQV